MRKKRGQVSTEFLLVIGIGLALIVPLIYVFYTHSVRQIDEVRINKLNEIGNRIVDTAEIVYYQGEPARLTLEESFPDGLSRIGINSSEDLNIYELVFVLQDGKEMAFSSRVPIRTEPIEGFDPEIASTEGMKKIKIEAYEDTDDPAVGTVVRIGLS